MRIVCPTCRKVLENAPEDHPPRPFCSPRCKLADLDNWLRGVYRISTPLESTDGGDAPDRIAGDGGGSSTDG